MQLCPQYMEPLVKVKKFGITNSGTLQSKEIVSLPKMFLSSNTTTPTITIKFYWKLFELMRKRYVRPEKTTNNQSSNALRVESTKMDNEDVLKDQWNRNEILEYSSLSYNFTFSRCRFRYSTNHYSSQVMTGFFWIWYEYGNITNWWSVTKSVCWRRNNWPKWDILWHVDSGANPWFQYYWSVPEMVSCSSIYLTLTTLVLLLTYSAYIQVYS